MQQQQHQHQNEDTNTDLTAGIAIDGKFEVLSLVATGGMGTVYKANQTLLDRLVAIKVLNRVVGEQGARERFEREIRAISLLKHQNIVNVYGCGVWNNTPYVVMEFIEGVTLESILSPQKPMTPAKTIELAKQICDAVQSAHTNSIIHRDLNPGNVMLMDWQGEQVVKIIDFGLAKLLPGAGNEIEEQKITATGKVIGSALYMSPEQCVGQPVDARTDIYAIGCLIYHCLTGSPPFSGSTQESIMNQHIHDTPRFPSEVRTDLFLPEGLEHVVLKAMAKAPQDRYQSAKELAVDLDRVRMGDSQALSCLRVMATEARLPPPPKPKPKLQGKLVPLFAVAALILSLAVLAFSVVAFNHGFVSGDQNSAKLLREGIGITPDREFDSIYKYYDLPDYRIALVQQALAQNERDHLLTAEDLIAADACLAVRAMDNRRFDEARRLTTHGLALPSSHSDERRFLALQYFESASFDPKALETLQTEVNATPAEARHRRPYEDLALIYAHHLTSIGKATEAEKMLTQLTHSKYRFIRMEARRALAKLGAVNGNRESVDLK